MSIYSSDYFENLRKSIDSSDQPSVYRDKANFLKGVQSRLGEYLENMANSIDDDDKDVLVWYQRLAITIIDKIKSFPDNIKIPYVLVSNIETFIIELLSQEIVEYPDNEKTYLIEFWLNRLDTIYIKETLAAKGES